MLMVVKELQHQLFLEFLDKNNVLFWMEKRDLVMERW